MVKLDTEKCSKCGICISQFENYCIENNNGYPSFIYNICNKCQKCISICPQQAITMNGEYPIKISQQHKKINNVEFINLIKKRRSCKKFKSQEIKKDVLLKIANTASYAPNQNKNIDIIIVDDKDIINAIDKLSFIFFNRIYKFLILPVYKITKTLRLSINTLETIIKKMNTDLVIRKKILKDNTQALFLAVGNPKVPITKESAPYLLATMLLYAELLGIGTCLMDSAKMTINYSKKIKSVLGIPKNIKVLGVLAAGYSDEKIINIPQGYKVKTTFNKYK